MDIKSIMRKYGIKADKRLGQHFLMDERPIAAILEAAELSSEDCVLEIGPGLGALTEKLCRRAKKVAAVEKDGDLIPALKNRVGVFENICIIEEDVLKLDLELLKNRYFMSDFKVVANLPYYITSPIIMKLVESRCLVKLAVIMVQKEVARRLTALPGGKDYGILSVAVQLHADVDIVCEVGSEAFVPPPKVDSAVVRIIFRHEPRVKLEDEAVFFEVVEAAFGHRRKILRNSLKDRLALCGISLDKIDDALEKAGIDPARRGETLSIEEFARLAALLRN
ncbi:MAG: 16S rRNA (adenine(1518)-N(6)/adenine(1519)-N(6))-dimethyltransferase RsmA [Tepidanaerobacteraceae bacterium]|jgi:16S rRNA (adenine1518-N6/adenine1519-N6)-dimethyltransferase|nr:16S rRNA (adenine(1518)-N(6)/adenine(1519)-N(6))-dimethyltransferase RsmA [Tepidanaerobacteraceae bacterium]